MKSSDQHSEVNDQANPEDGEPTSFAESVRDWCKKQKPKILAVGAIGLAFAGVVASLAERRDAHEGSEPASPPEATAGSRQPPGPYGVEDFRRKLPPGQRASPAKRAKYKEVTGEDLPPGYTFVDGWSVPGRTCAR
ncbi:hypothetical protein [Streptomyces sp. CMB-StM0423]|uniref:hypothetical protein n=1 Tax=Streptomyces sp. CMB-StM0423 TaxID=2059884 RepID=UPI00131ADDE3|nr:hypothetical protein [Streptomyces sp. CMB-StM0423]